MKEKQHKQRKPSDKSKDTASKMKLKTTQKAKKTTEQPDRKTIMFPGHVIKNKWKPTSKVTRDYMNDLMSSVASDVLNKNGLQSRGEVQDHLSILQQRLMGLTDKLKVPSSSKTVDYRKLESHLRHLDDVLVANTNTVVKLEMAVEHQDRLVDEKEQELLNLEKNHQESSNADDQQSECTKDQLSNLVKTVSKLVNDIETAKKC